MRIGAIEGGGTKFICGIGNENGEILERVSFPTEQPGTTLANVISYFRDKQVEAIGIGSFGPVDVDVTSPKYGYITTTPKPGWGDCDFLGTMKRAFDVPFGWDTDVNAAAYGEAVWGAAKGLQSCVYFTIGTGVGTGIYLEGNRVHGLVHSEGGHILTRRHPDDQYGGYCVYHRDCLEGMASGPAIEDRWGMKGSELPADHPAWAIEAFYIAQAVSSTILLMSPQKVILGGGVMHQEQLFPMIHEEVRRNLNGYVHHAAILTDIADFIVPPGLGDNAGLRGALALGLEALKK